MRWGSETPTWRPRHDGQAGGLGEAVASRAPRPPRPPDHDLADAHCHHPPPSRRPRRTRRRAARTRTPPAGDADGARARAGDHRRSLLRDGAVDPDHDRPELVAPALQRTGHLPRLLRTRLQHHPHPHRGHHRGVRRTRLHRPAAAGARAPHPALAGLLRPAHIGRGQPARRRRHPAEQQLLPARPRRVRRHGVVPRDAARGLPAPPPRARPAGPRHASDRTGARGGHRRLLDRGHHAGRAGAGGLHAHLRVGRGVHPVPGRRHDARAAPRAAGQRASAGSLPASAGGLPARRDAPGIRARRAFPPSDRRHAARAGAHAAVGLGRIDAARGHACDPPSLRARRV